MSGLDLEKTYFEEHAAEILAAANMNKAQFAKEMGVLPQNINKLIATKNALLLTKVATVLNTTIQMRRLSSVMCTGVSISTTHLTFSTIEQSWMNY